MRAYGAALLTFLAITAQVVLAEDAPGVTDKEILVGSCAVLSGPASLLGTETLRGAQAYLNHINSQGGVNGRTIRLLSCDDNYEPAKAIECFNRLKKENVFCAAFFVGTPTAAKHAPMAEAAKLPIVGLFTGAQFLRDPFKRYVINVRASYFDEARTQVEHLWAQGLKKIGVIYQDDAFGAAVLEGVKAALKTHDSAPVALGSFPRNTLDLDAGIGLVKAGAPDAVVLVGPYKPVAEIVKRSKAGGWSPIFSTVSFVGTEAFIKEAGPAGEGTVITQVVPPSTRTDLPTVESYLKLLKESFPTAEPSFTSLEGFVDAMVLVEGLKRAGKDLTREKLVDAIDSMSDFQVGLGPQLTLKYGKDQHRGFDQVYSTVVRNGQAVIISDWKELKGSK